MIYFTSDSHFGHANFIHKYKIRDFENVEEMNERLIECWNSRVKPGDIVYHLGDFSFTTPEETVKIISRLNGSIHYIRGNHERSLDGFKHKFAWVGDYKEISVPYDGPGNNGGKVKVVLCHYPFKTWNGSHRGTFNFFGHVHTTEFDTAKSLDVGVDSWDYYPITFAQALIRMAVIDQPYDFATLILTKKCPDCNGELVNGWREDGLWCETCKKVFTEWSK